MLGSGIPAWATWSQALIAIEWSLRSGVSHIRLRAKFIAIVFVARFFGGFPPHLKYADASL
jgi:hypothetical protein